MDQQINLYLPEFHVRKDPVTPLLLGQILGVAIGLMALVAGWNMFTRWQLNNELSDQNAVLAQETQRTNEVDQILARRSRDNVLTQRLDLAEETLESSQQIRDFLNETTLGNVVGFSDYIKDLSRASFSGMSISSFAFTEGGRSVSLTGQVLDSAMVPRFVNNISGGSSPLQNLYFSPSISRAVNETPYYSFELRSSADE